MRREEAIKRRGGDGMERTRGGCVMMTEWAISARIWVRRVGSVCMWSSIQKTRDADFVLML